MSDDIAYRQRRYLIMMAIRAVCFIVAVIMYVNHAGWLTAIPAAGAIAIPYFAVVFANGGREPTGTRGFRPYEPNLPVPYAPPGPGATGQNAAGQNAAGQNATGQNAAGQSAAGQATRSPSAGTQQSGGPASGRDADPGTPGANGAPPHNA
jgi:Protein of unknown function (DUF3099)